MTHYDDDALVHALLNRRSIRKFKPDPISDDVIDVLERAAQRAPSSNYLNDWSAIRIIDDALKHELAKIGHQTYIAQAPLLYVFVADHHRNVTIARNKGVEVPSDGFVLDSSYRFAQAQNDAAFALHAMETAANALGLGCVMLGSLLNDVDRLIDLLHLPDYTYPVLGLAIGKPDQQPALKPRMPKTAQFFDDAYPSDDESLIKDLNEFDAVVHTYYDLRHADRPVDAFSDQVVSSATDTDTLEKGVAAPARRQRFRLDR